ncbi:hypothetical protein BJ138DRAFT_420945 [Hygrophoropsis aurantiaca]|uniref:Uncharacterized protein n=1 Tax=Hygrophoropsis aurantiaca TaxID=72124 RepID=A0ACB8ANR6_9AGAM|nr:hypothetical protein BJ138DRAFT_420945 [Hygrophoropsis aurantiaca]
MDSSPTKRILTDDVHATRLALDMPRSDALPDELLASLKNVGRRVRKNVLEGYRTAPTTPHSSPKKQGLAYVSGDHQPPPANSTLRDTLPSSSSGHYTPTASPSKRRRSNDHSIEHDPRSNDESTVDMESEDQGDVMDSISDDESQSAPRPVKPLRRKVLMEASAVGPLRYPGTNGIGSSAVRQTTIVNSIMDVFIDSASDDVPQRPMEL